MLSQMTLEEWMEQRFTRPVVLLESSAAADAICARNGLDTIQLLRPHSVYTGGTLSARTGDRSDPITCSRFGVRLMRTDCVRDVALSQVTRHVRRLMRSASATDMAYGEQLDRALECIVKGSRSRHDGSLPHPIHAVAPSASLTAANTVGSTGGPSPSSTLLERACPTWHHAFVRDFHSLVRCNAFETIDHPVGVLFAVATSETGGIEGIMQVFRAQAKRVAELKASLPGMDNELHRYYLILHDNTAPTTPSLSTARQMLTALQQLYGINYCALIKVNSVLDPRAVKNLDPSLWVDASPAVMDVPSAQAIQRAASTVAPPSASVTPTHGAVTAAAAVSSSPSAAVPVSTCSAVLSFRTVTPTCGTWPNSYTSILTGCYMSPEDVTEVRNVMAYYLSQSLFKYVERRLRMLDVSVQDRRTTTLGKMAAWFKGKDEVRPRTADVTYPPNGSDPSVLPSYVASSLEMQMRHCGDLALALHDYDGAIVYYRLCIEELLETLSQRPFNRAMIAACQEAIGVAQVLQRRAPPPSLTPWYTGVTSCTHRISSQTNRWEVAWNDYLAAGMHTSAIRAAFLIYEYCRTRMPPMLDRCRASLLHLQRCGVLQRQNLLNGVVNDMLAGIAIFSNAPFAAGLMVPPAIPRDYPMFISLRRFARYLQQAGAFYRADNSLDQALRCYLRVLELFRLIDPQETWKNLAEHLYITVGQLYTQLGQDVRGIAMASAAVAQGTPLYRQPDTAQQAFKAFWTHQKHVLDNMGYALCPHMPMPRILRASFHVDRNYYSTDATTDEVARRMSETTAEAEWRGIEKQLKKTYTESVLKTNPQYRFPPLHGGLSSTANNSNSEDCNNNNTRRDGDGSRSRRRIGGRAASAATHYKAYDYIFADPAAPGDPPRPQRHYTIARAEPLVLSFVMENTIGSPIEATGLTLLYLSHTAPDQLWKSSTTQTVKLAAGARQRVSLSFDPVTEGEYSIIGLCWSLMGQEGYYYFATRESRPGCPESLYEYAIEHPIPTLEASENIHVTVQPSKACVTATFQPRLPDRLFDGEYFHTKLVVHNTSTQQDATHVLLQRSPTAAHLMYIEEFSLEKNLDFEAPLVLADHLKAQETRTFTVTIRGQHRHGDVSLQSSGNYFFLLLAYLPGTLQDHERRLKQQQQQQVTTGATTTVQTASEVDVTSVDTPGTESMPASGVASPTVTTEHHQLLGDPLTVGKFPPNTPPTVMVRLHRLLRRCDVLPMLTMFSTVLPPTNASLKAAVMLTVKNVCVATPARTRPSSIPAGTGTQLSLKTSNEAVRAIPVAAQPLQEMTTVPTAAAATPAHTPLRIARVLAVHSSRWRVECNGINALVADHATQYLLTQGECLTLSLLVKRRPRGLGVADTTARHLFLRRGSSPLLGKDGIATTLSAEETLLSPYTDTACLPLEKALPSPSRIKNVEAHLGTTVSQSSRNLFFLQTSCLGPGRIGAQSSSEKSGGLAFYADKAGQQKQPPKSAEQLRRDEVAEECRLCGAAMEQYTPLALAVTWVLEGSEGLRKGQLFLFVDPIEHIYQAVLQQQKRHANVEAAAQLRPVAAVSFACGGSAASVEQTQQELCEAMLVRYASLKPWQGAVVSHVHVPPLVRACHSGNRVASAAAPAAPSLTVEIPVTLRCMSLAPLPLLVTADALPPSAPSCPPLGVSPVHPLVNGPASTRGAWETQWQNSMAMSQPPSTPATPPTPQSSSPLTGVRQRSGGSNSGEVPVLFVGKTLHTFLLMPSEEFEVKFTAYALRPGIVDCQRITLRAAPICFVHDNVEADDYVNDEGNIGNGSMTSLVQPLMRTGMTLPALVRTLLERRASSFLVSKTTRFGGEGGDNTANSTREAMRNGSRSNLAHPQNSACTPHGPAETAAAATAGNSLTKLVERYGPLAAELLHQLSPRGPAASATVCQVIPQTTPALTRVVLDEIPFNAFTPTSPSGASSVGNPARAHEVAYKFFRQLDVFEAEVKRAAQASCNSASPDPFLPLYVYRPTVKSLDGGSTDALQTSSNNSLTMKRSSAAARTRAWPAASVASARTSVSAVCPSSPQFTAGPGARSEPQDDGFTPAESFASVEEKVASPIALPLTTAATASPPAPVVDVPEQQQQLSSSVFGSATAAESVAGPAGAVNGKESDGLGAARRSFCNTTALPFTHALSWGNNRNNGGATDAFLKEEADYMNVDKDGDEDHDNSESDGYPASPLHLPAVAFESRAAAAAKALDISEGSSSSTAEEATHFLRRRQCTTGLVPAEVIHAHENSHHGVESDDGSSRNSELVTNTLTDIRSETPLPGHSCNQDFADLESMDETMDLVRRHPAAQKTEAETLSPSPQPVSDSTAAQTDPLRQPSHVLQLDTTSSSSSSSGSSSSSSSATS